MRPLRPSLRPKARLEVSESSRIPLRPSIMLMKPGLESLRPGWRPLGLSLSLKPLRPSLRPEARLDARLEAFQA